MPEMLDIVDENGSPTYRAVARTQAPRRRDCATAHKASVILRKNRGAYRCFLQMRCAAGDSYPGAMILRRRVIPAGAESLWNLRAEVRNGRDATSADL